MEIIKINLKEHIALIYFKCVLYIMYRFQKIRQKVTKSVKNEMMFVMHI